MILFLADGPKYKCKRICFQGKINFCYTLMRFNSSPVDTTFQLLMYFLSINEFCLIFPQKKGTELILTTTKDCQSWPSWCKFQLLMPFSYCFYATSQQVDASNCWCHFSITMTLNCNSWGTFQLLMPFPIATMLHSNKLMQLPIVDSISTTQHSSSWCTYSNCWCQFPIAANTIYCQKQPWTTQNN